MESDAALRYWRERLAGVAQPTRLGIANGGTARAEALAEAPSQALSARATLAWTSDRTALLGRAADSLGLRTEHLLLAAWGLVLAAHAGELDVVFGIEAGRPDADPVPLRLDARPDRSLRGYLDEVRAGTGLGREHAQLTMDQLTACADLPADTPLIDTMVRCRPSTDRSDAPAGCAVVLTALLGPEPALMLDHCDAALAATDARRLLSHVDRMLTAITEATARDRAQDVARTTVGDLHLLSVEEYRQVVHEWNDTARDWGEPLCLHELFERQAARTPDALAVVQGERRLTYAELDAAADRLAARLAAAGVGCGDQVALSLRRTVHTVVALLGVLKSGAAYAPLDPALPAGRFRALVEALGAPVVLTDPEAVSGILDRCRGLDTLREVLWLGDAAADDSGGDQPAAGLTAVGWALGEVPAGSPTPDRARPGDLAYTIFTSGSTGTPKGVLMTHAPAVNLIHWVNETYRIGPDDQVLFIASLSFDLSVYDVFGLLAAGGSIRVAAGEEVRDPQRLLALLDGEPITFWDSAPAALQQLQPFLALREAPAEHSLRLVFLSGDWVPLALPDDIRAAFAEPEVIALGGATEAAIWSNFHPVGKVDPSWTSIPYGRPIANARYYVLDAGRRPAPVGAPGDLYIGGPCLAVGYLGDPRLTEARFVPDPFGADPGGRLYATGDRARFWPDGTIEFLGRQDHQVKIRGFRVELGEVESGLAVLPGVASAVAVVHDTAAGARLTGYAVRRPGAVLDPGALRAALAERLPAYMVPAQVVVLDALPATANGKLDRAALPVPDAAVGRPPHVPPRTPVEQAVADMWAEVLDVQGIGVDDNFFDLGGHSLLITQVMARLQSDLEVEVPLLAMLDHQTLGGFAAVVEQTLVEQIEQIEGMDDGAEQRA
ncbi:amino acid adenylation domain-containing protein [Streptacidiphilus sp. EB129]|uniref:non-ribosomal peptide synthetase n=1 Tax=Streptacidiphilus sp. EB129 TaxID=3156262 RepID=UPI00351299B4